MPDGASGPSPAELGISSKDLGIKEGNKPVILPTANPEGTVQIADPEFTQAGFPETIDAGTLYFYGESDKGRKFSSTLTVDSQL